VQYSYDLSSISIVDLEAIEGPVFAELRPIFDPALRRFSVQLWRDGEPLGVHGLGDVFRHAEELLETIDGFLAEKGVRALTEQETAVIYVGLIKAKGGEDWAVLRRQISSHPA
jgi:hypothetical protein